MDVYGRGIDYRIFCYYMRQKHNDNESMRRITFIYHLCIILSVFMCDDTQDATQMPECINKCYVKKYGWDNYSLGRMPRPPCVLVSCGQTTIFVQGRYKRPSRGAYTESDNAPARK